MILKILRHSSQLVYFFKTSLLILQVAGNFLKSFIDNVLFQFSAVLDFGLPSRCHFYGENFVYITSTWRLFACSKLVTKKGWFKVTEQLERVK